MIPQNECHELEGYQNLEDLALDLRSTWNHSADVIWKRLDPELWELTNNPWAVLQSTSKKRLAGHLADQQFRNLVNDLTNAKNESLESSKWFQKNYANTPLKAIAYFSLEFMLSEALPIYSGGLGNVAGDQLKAASDLGVPLIAIGLLYSQGYFRQFIDKNGNQQELYPYNDPGQLPVRLKRLPNGELLRLKIELPGWSFWLRTWEVKVGRTTLYLLDSNDIANFPAHRGITSELYGGDRELRLKQELILGIGGWRLLEALGIQPEICHMNEGHSAFAILERAHSYMEQTKQPFDIALAATRIGNLFTTHTAVSAGFDRFSPDLIAKYLGTYAHIKLGITIDQLLSLGQLHPGDDFNMAYLAIRGSGFVNGVSQLHEKVSKNLFKDLFPRYPENEIPVGYVTNGVHMPSWDSTLSDQLWTETCGKNRWREQTEGLEEKIRAVPNDKIWKLRNESRLTLVEYTRARLVNQLEARGAPKEEIESAQHFLHPDALTLGFARRFAAYKRPDLLLHDEERFLRLLMNHERPVQLIIAGKAHPEDQEGHLLIKKWMKFITTTEARAHVIFLSDYDMILTQHLVQGVDLWINTPRRPWEACGTSGMKVLVNGGLNISELDGWWAEAYDPALGWALGDRREHANNSIWDGAEALALYDLLENEVIPEFYKRDERNIPIAWTTRIRESMAKLTPYFSSNRAVRDYTEKFYLPGAQQYHLRTQHDGTLAKKIAHWKALIELNWENIKFGETKIQQINHQYLFESHIYLNGLPPESIKVELYSEAQTQEMKYQGPIPFAPNMHVFTAQVQAVCHSSYFTPRILPQFAGVSIPLEAPKILWQR